MPHPNDDPESAYLNGISSFLNSSLSMSFPAKHTTPNEIKYLIISKLKLGKSPRYDLITNKILQHFPYKSLITTRQYTKYIDLLIKFKLHLKIKNTVPGIS
jgi:hypothetical protein